MYVCVCVHVCVTLLCSALLLGLLRRMCKGVEVCATHTMPRWPTPLHLPDLADAASGAA